jgi:hypothetical protein
MNQEDTVIRGLIAQDFDLQVIEDQDEEALLAHVARRVEQLLEGDKDFLMGMLYRLDVLEEKILAALSKTEKDPVPLALAKLILERQKQRYKSKLNSFKPLPDDMQDLAW